MVLQGTKAVFFDLDNTLIDTTAAGRKAIEEVINVLQSKYHCDEREACMICDKFQAKLLKECHDPSKMCITDLRIQHCEEAIQESSITQFLHICEALDIKVPQDVEKEVKNNVSSSVVSLIF
ncbi:hypothetical protein JD844_017454 [Phrynosoma platyrhinos]|uniref:Uncharacterized protein n=1 Tax=Phrynosoma platyrhinos TaxID=52577 RepID=A0ABQ7SLZ4_PHRPL|nr:hypothetical protein JD844_017454 [Phrynosoma platyrhinos]